MDCSVHSPLIALSATFVYLGLAVIELELLQAITNAAITNRSAIFLILINILFWGQKYSFY